MFTQQNVFIVLQQLAGDAFQPVFANDDGLMLFIDQASAQLEIADAINSVSEAIAEGNMDEDSRVGDDDYLIVPATVINPHAEPSRQIISCYFDGDEYRMKRSSDDWEKVNLHNVINECDTAFAVLFIGADHGITPQAMDACQNAAKIVRKTLLQVN
jgi:hypothetical protein